MIFKLGAQQVSIRAASDEQVLARWIIVSLSGLKLRHKSTWRAGCGNLRMEDVAGLVGKLVVCVSKIIGAKSAVSEQDR